MKFITSFILLLSLNSHAFIEIIEARSSMKETENIREHLQEVYLIPSSLIETHISEECDETKEYTAALICINKLGHISIKRIQREVIDKVLKEFWR